MALQVTNSHPRRCPTRCASTHRQEASCRYVATHRHGQQPPYLPGPRGVISGIGNAAASRQCGRSVVCSRTEAEPSVSSSIVIARSEAPACQLWWVFRSVPAALVDSSLPAPGDARASAAALAEARVAANAHVVLVAARRRGVSEARGCAEAAATVVDASGETCRQRGSGI